MTVWELVKQLSEYDNSLEVIIRYFSYDNLCDTDTEDMSVYSDDTSIFLDIWDL